MLAPPGFVGKGSGGVVNAIVGEDDDGDMTDERVLRTTGLSLELEVELEMRGVSAGFKVLVLDAVIVSGATSTTTSSFSGTGSYTGGGWGRATEGSWRKT
jgi:hypothetical protein